MDYFVKYDEISQILMHGPTKSSVILKDNIQVDLRVVEPKSFGAALQYFTGSKEHNVKLRAIARFPLWTDRFDILLPIGYPK